MKVESRRFAKTGSGSGHALEERLKTSGVSPRSNAGLIIAGNTLNGLIEGNTIVNSSVGINVTAPLHDPTSPFDGQNVVKHVLVTNNNVTLD